MSTTREFAASHGVCGDDTVPPVADYNKPYARTAEHVALRTIILHCVAAVGYKVDSVPIVEWLKEVCIWDQVTPKEEAFLFEKAATNKQLSDARWRQEAEWALLWTIGRVDALGLPTRQCDTGRLVDEIMPALGDSCETFVNSAKLRPPSELLAEDDRIYNLHCYVRQAFRSGKPPPDDLIYDVLFQRHYAFDWLRGVDPWDKIPVDT